MEVNVGWLSHYHTVVLWETPCDPVLGRPAVEASCPHRAELHAGGCFGADAH